MLSGSDDASAEVIVNRLLGSTQGPVSYDQIEEIMVMFGLDPYEEEDTYQAILDLLDQRDVLVVEQLNTDDFSNGAVGTTVDDISVAELHRVLGALDRDISRLLTADEERTLLEVVCDGRTARRLLEDAEADEDITLLRMRVAAGKRAEEELVSRNVRLVAKQAIATSRVADNLDTDDLIQEGLCGLLRAIRGFDPNQSLRLSTYASYWIRQAITRALADQDRTIRLPVYRIEMLNRYRVAIRELTEEMGRAPTDLELAVAVGLVDPGQDPAIQAALTSENSKDAALEQRYKGALRQIRTFRSLDETRLISLDQPAGEDGTTELVELLVDHRQLLPEDEVTRHALCEAIDDVLAQLSDREAYVIRRRFGLNGEMQSTLQEIGDHYDVTRERIRQIQEKALRRLRHPVRSRKLRYYLSRASDGNIS